MIFSFSLNSPFKNEHPVPTCSHICYYRTYRRYLHDSVTFICDTDEGWEVCEGEREGERESEVDIEKGRER